MFSSNYFCDSLYIEALYHVIYILAYLFDFRNHNDSALSVVGDGSLTSELEA